MDDWNKWSNHVLKELERLEQHQKDMNDMQVKILQEVATLRVKSGFIGALAGTVPAAIVLLSKYFGA